ncbi:ATP synthase subunit g, mitochondrial [Aplysia californica]|uniref:ATP synthase subunit g n=1 Tax=Aplysia californica TaxID=6500 RepID=A0ABM0JNE4_APLCA|nr:ATP synthase subunit g, mitochondrial [Aplysia californica]
MAKVVAFFTRVGTNVVTSTRPKLATAWKYSKVELRPPSFSEIPEVQHGFQKLIASYRTGAYKQLTVREAWLNTLIGAEIFFWFVAGECIGKGGVIGYNIPGAVNWDMHF